MKRRPARTAGAVVIAAIAVASVAAAAGEEDVVRQPASATIAAGRVDSHARTFSVLFAGDILTEDRVLRMGAAAAPPGQQYDFAPMFAPVSDIVRSADLAVCHMELPISGPGQRSGYAGRSPYGGNLLSAPFEMADSVRRTGFDRCSTASNHSNDLGVAGIDSTLAAFDDAGISHAGTARQVSESGPQVFTVNGVGVAHLAYTRYSNTAPPQDSWRVAFAATPTQVAGDVDAARRAGAEVVIVSLHLSQEMQTGPTPDDRNFATQVVQLAHVDMMVHHGPHVAQPMEMVHGTPIWWSIGNFVSSMGTPGRGRYTDPRSRDGLLATARFSERPDGSFAMQPWTVLVCNEAVDRTVRAPIHELADPSLPPSLRAEMQACVDRTLRVYPDIH